MSQHPQTFEKQICKTVRLDYLLHLPRDYDPVRRFPLILFLHGSGQRGDDLEQIKRHGITKIAEAHEDFPFIAVSPQCPADSDWIVRMDDLNALLDHISANYAVDPARIYLTGLSMGGRGAYQLAFVAPHRFAAMAIVSARRPDVFRSPDRAATLRHLPIWIFHGAQDVRVPATEAREMEHALRACNGDVRLTIYPDAEHDAWTRAYENPELYVWLLEHKRGTP
jgi:predicted peptidase